MLRLVKPSVAAQTRFEPLAARHTGLLLLYQTRCHTTDASKDATLIHIPKANVYRFGDGNHAPPALRDLEWTVKPGENWAVIGSGTGHKTTVFEVG